GWRCRGAGPRPERRAQQQARRHHEPDQRAPQPRRRPEMGREEAPEAAQLVALDEPARRRAGALHMRAAEARHEPGGAAPGGQAAAEIEILDMEEIALVHAAQTIEGGAR